MSLRVENMLRPRKQISRRTYLVPGMCAFLSWTAAFDLSQNQLQLQSTCDPLPFTRETWKKLNIDKYISEYPGGHNLTVNDYAAKVGAKNFQCGISEWCNAGQVRINVNCDGPPPILLKLLFLPQMCHPVKGLDWYVLFAIQEWNERVNTLYSAIGLAMSLVQANLFSITSALFPQPDNLRIFSSKVHFAMGATLASLVLVLLPVVVALTAWESIIAFYGSYLIFGATIFSVVSVATRYKDAPQDAFGLASEVNYQITNYQQQVQEALRNETRSRFNTPISSPQGMAGALLGGSHLDPTRFRSVDQIESELQNITVAASVAHILKSMDPCNGSGKDGAWSGDNVLSFCNSNGTMFNIITVSPGKSKVQNHIPNAATLSSKFGITTEYLTSSAIKCHESRKNSITNHPNVTLSAVEQNGAADCIIDLPVCDCRSEKFKERRKHVGTVKACREAGVSI
ncbi:hypothetical protein VP01_2398g1 [Puccinia sorghi]|uniref:DUF7872 domain-containing protein n=1 Tax=Puccinia sorghi TaxID=27349 RepID=A0A0L6V6Q0_9BASI|nr:hypothetical protein VP01_2398g1 [Puccinia sorghi]